MSEGKLPDQLESYFTMFAEIIKSGDTKGVKWKESAKSILWADEEISRLREELKKYKAATEIALVAMRKSYYDDRRILYVDIDSVNHELGETGDERQD